MCDPAGPETDTIASNFVRRVVQNLTDTSTVPCRRGAATSSTKTAPTTPPFDESDNYECNTAVVRLEGKTPAGPFKFVETVLPLFDVKMRTFLPKNSEAVFVFVRTSLVFSFFSFLRC